MTPGPVDGDINGDGVTDCADLAMLKSDWSTAKTRSDLDRDGAVGFSDWRRLMSVWSAAAGQCATAPAAPTGLFSVPLSGSAELGWRRQGDVFFWRVYQSGSVDGPWVEAVGSPAVGNSAVVDGLVDGNAYFLSVTAVGVGGESLKSEPVRVVPVDVPQLSPRIAANGHVLRGTAVLAAQDLGGGAVQLDVSAAQFVGGLGDPVVVEPSSNLPMGMFGRIRSLSPGPDGALTVQLEPAALDEVFPNQQISFDAAPVLVDTGATDNGISARRLANGATRFSMSADIFECSKEGIPKHPSDLWETDWPFPITADLSNLRAIHEFDSQTLLIGLYGELDTKFSLRAKSAFECELSSRWRRAHAVSATIARIRGVPVTLRFEWAFQFETSASGEVSFSQHRYWGVSVEKRGGSAPTFRRPMSADPAEFNSVGGLSTSFFGGGDLSLMFGGGPGSANATAGLYLTFGPTVDGSVKTEVPLCLTVALALRIDGGIRLNLWSKRWDLNMISLSMAREVLLQKCVAATPPDSPSQPTLTPGDRQIVVAWSPPANDGGSPVTGYTATATPGGQVCSTSGLSCTVSGLTNGVLYSVTIAAANAVGVSAPSQAAAAIPGTSDGGGGAARAISAGGHSCALLTEGNVKCWGGHETSPQDIRTTARLVSGIAESTAITSGGGHSCALLPEGTVKCWGYNAFGQLGDGTESDRSTPVLVTGIAEAVAITAGLDHSCALLSGGSVECWGWNGAGQLGEGSRADRSSPVPVHGLTDAVAVTAADHHSCALLSDGAVRCWGSNLWGQLGNGSTESSVAPVAVPEISNAIAITAAGSHSCALLAGGTVKCWGWNYSGELGDGTTNNRFAPVTVLGITGATAITAGGSHSCALLTGGTLRCWGNNYRGGLGDATTTNRLTPVAVAQISDATAVAAGTAHTCALLSRGGVKCWGYNGFGELGDGTTTDRSTPVSVLGLTGAAQLPPATSIRSRRISHPLNAMGSNSHVGGCSGPAPPISLQLHFLALSESIGRWPPSNNRAASACPAPHKMSGR